MPTMTEQEVYSGVQNLLDGYTNLTVSESEDAFEVKLQKWDLSITFETLMKIAKIFGTTKIDINNEVEFGAVYSEYTRDSDTVIQTIRVLKSDIGSGVPW